MQKLTQEAEKRQKNRQEKSQEEVKGEKKETDTDKLSQEVEDNLKKIDELNSFKNSSQTPDENVKEIGDLRGLKKRKELKDSQLDKQKKGNFYPVEETDSKRHQSNDNLKKGTSKSNRSTEPQKAAESYQAETKKPTLLIIGIILIVGSVLAVGYLLGKENQKSS